MVEKVLESLLCLNLFYVITRVPKILSAYEYLNPARILGLKVSFFFFCHL